MGDKRTDLWYYGNLGDKEYNSEEKNYVLEPMNNCSKEKIVIMGYQIGTGTVIINGEKPNEYIEDLGELQIIYRYINDGNDLDIEWKWKKIEVKATEGEPCVPKPLDPSPDGESDEWPESYREGINKLKERYPNWVFERLDVKITWKEFIDIQDKGETNLVQNISSWSKSWFEKRTSAEKGWGIATRSLIEYYADPRNFLDEKYIFQFEKIVPFRNEFHALDGLSSLLKKSFLKDFKDYFYEAGKDANCSPYFLAEKSMLEMGKGNTLTKGTVEKYEGYYNFYNIGAYVTKDKMGNKTGANTNGAIYSKKQEWNSVEKAIIGGGKWINSKYFSKGQITQYLFKFNALDRGKNQFVQNVMASKSEVEKRFDTYKEMGVVNKKIVFLIPVYKEMPSVKCQKPN